MIAAIVTGGAGTMSILFAIFAADEWAHDSTVALGWIFLAALAFTLAVAALALILAAFSTNKQKE